VSDVSKKSRWYKTDYGSGFVIFIGAIAVSVLISCALVDCRLVEYRLPNVPLTETPETKARFEVEFQATKCAHSRRIVECGYGDGGPSWWECDDCDKRWEIRSELPEWRK